MSPVLNSHSWVAAFVRTLLRLRPDISCELAVRHAIAHLQRVRHLDPQVVARIAVQSRHMPRRLRA